jgi:hypothetical protein
MGRVKMEFTEAHAYYYVLRNRSRKKVVDDLNAVANASGIARHIRGLTLSSITRDATDYARLEWVKYYGPDTHQGFAHFSWERLHHKYRNRPSMFDLAIWQTIDEKQVLQALALGQPSNRKTQLNLNWIERSFAPTYLKIGALIPILACAEEYAKLIGAARVVVKDAVDPAIYARYGYDMVRLPQNGGMHPVKEL